MSLTVTSRLQEDVAILELQGALTLGPALGSVREASQKVLNGNARFQGLILLVNGVTMIDSSGLGELTLVYSLVAKRNCATCLVGVAASLKRMLEMTRIDELLPSFETTDEAIRFIKTRKRL